MNTNVDSDTEYETDEQSEDDLSIEGDTPVNKNKTEMIRSKSRVEDDDFGLESDEEEEEESDDEEESTNTNKLNTTGKFNTLKVSANTPSSNNRYDFKTSTALNTNTNNLSNNTTNRQVVVTNQPYDEIIETNGEEVHSIPSPEQTPRNNGFTSNNNVNPSPMVIGNNTPTSTAISSNVASNVVAPNNSNRGNSNNRVLLSQQQKEKQVLGMNNNNKAMIMRGNDSDDEEEEEDEDGDEEEEEEDDDEEESEDDDDNYKRPILQHASSYNAQESNLLLSKMNISNELKELFSYINRYKPHEIELETKLKPFIPDYIAAIGELDPFIKIKRPDIKESELDDLGLRVLDEPNSRQSDPTVVTLDLTYQMKGDVSTNDNVNLMNSNNVTKQILNINNNKDVSVVKSVESGNSKLIQKWISDLREIHQKKPPPTVNYTKLQGIDFTQLIQTFPEHFEEELNSIELPSADLDVELEDYIKIICNLLDIPVHEDHLIESLHVLFTLYLEFKANQHFQNQINF
ncbi:hypothetical protein ABK040_005197 [Willaertia magna]